MANANSSPGLRRPADARGSAGRRWFGRLWPMLLLAPLALAAPDRLEEAYTEARTAYQSAPTNATVAWRFARACFDRAFVAADKPLRAAFAEEGMSAARAAVKADPKSAPGFYYLALNVGQLASTKTLGALGLVKDMESHLLTARRLDKTFDYGGPDRTLGLLYRDTPGWPLSVGSRKKARRHLEQALAIAPEYFENHLNLLETLLDRHEHAAARAAAFAARKILPKARRRFTGDRWAASWRDWNARWVRVEARLARSKSAVP